MSKILGKYKVHYKELDSTQKEIWRKIENGNIKNGTIIIADIQTDAIGTHGRKWYTTQKNNIAFSIFVDIDTNINNLENLTIESAKILKNIFLEKYKIKIEIKTPNDLIINNKKIGGILIQTKLQGEIVRKLVIGIGINTFQEEFDDEIKDIATSIKKEFGIDVDNKYIIDEFCNRFEQELFNRLGEF